ncbi:hypothetical protein [Xanthomonas axonopodis]|uniref:hypothetical protein n=1 Tax=Xanthomonas axonopodis TaxID=53413 RepID=UPI003557356C
MDLVAIARKWPVGTPMVAAGIGSALTICVIDNSLLWTAEAAGWAAAIGTVAAVFAALHIAKEQSAKADRAQRLKAKWVALELRHVLARWRGRVAYIERTEDRELYEILDDDKFPSPTDIPSDLLALQGQLHELGDDAAPIAEAIWLARSLSRTPVREAIAGNLGTAGLEQGVIGQYRAGLRSLSEHLGAAEARVSDITGLTAPESRTFA